MSRASARGSSRSTKRPIDLGCSLSYFYATLYSKLRVVKLGKRTLVDFASLDKLADSFPAAR
jgi:hypothetical protein